MNINVLALNKAMDLAGRGRMIAPHHYAKASGLEWYAARRELRELARLHFLIPLKNGQFVVTEFSVDD